MHKGICLRSNFLRSPPNKKSSIFEDILHIFSKHAVFFLQKKMPLATPRPSSPPRPYVPPPPTRPPVPPTTPRPSAPPRPSVPPAPTRRLCRMHPHGRLHPHGRTCRLHPCKSGFKQSNVKNRAFSRVFFLFFKACSMPPATPWPSAPTRPSVWRMHPHRPHGRLFK